MRVLVIYFALMLICEITCAQTDKKIDSLLTELHKPQSDTVKIKILHDLGRKYRAKRNKLAIDYCEKAIALSLKINDKRKTMVGYSLLASAQKDFYQYASALESYLRAIPLADELKDKKSIVYLNNYIGNIYLEQKTPHKAMDYYTIALRHATDNNDAGMQAAILNNMGIIYFDLKDFDKSLEYHLRSQKLKEGYKDTQTGIGQSYASIGEIYELRGDVKTARENYYKAFYAFRWDKDNYSECCVSMGKSFLATNELDSSLKYARKAFKLDSSRKTIPSLVNSAKLLSQLYEKMERFDLALAYHKKHIQARDSIFNAETTKGIATKEMQFEFDKKNQEAQVEQAKKDLAYKYQKEQAKLIAETEKKELAREELLKRKQIEFRNQEEKNRITSEKEKNELKYRGDILRKEQDNKTQQKLIYIFVIGFCLMILLSFFIFRSYRLKRKANIVILEKKKEIEEQKLLVEEKNKEITDSIHYAKRIQTALIPSDKYIQRILNDLKKEKS